jgi:hypothetical protein
MRRAVVLGVGLLLGYLVAIRPGTSAQEAGLPPIFKAGTAVCTIRGATPGERFQVEEIRGTWVRVRGVGGATRPYWIKPESLQVGFLECGL